MADWPALAKGIQMAAQQALGEPATYAPVVGSSFAIRGVFSEVHEQVEVGADVTISSVGPAISVHLADVTAAPVRGDIVTVRGKDYKVVDVQPDGEGDADLILKVA